MKTLLMLLSLLFSITVNAEIVVVVSKDSDTGQLKHEDVANIFLARTNRFPSGDRTDPVEYTEKEVRDRFYRIVTGKTPKQLGAYWTSLIFTGKGRPPRKYQDLDTLLKAVESHPDKITYLKGSQVTEQMKIVYRLQ